MTLSDLRRDAALNVALPAKTKARVCVVSDVRIYRDSLVFALERALDFEVVPISGVGTEAIAAAVAAHPDVVVIDMGTLDRMDVVRLARRELSSAKIVAFGVDDNEQDIIACAEIGVAGYLCRDAPGEELAETVRSAVQDEIICSPKIAASLFRRIAALAGRAAPSDDHLTIRERQVLALIRDGLANKQIAAELTIAESTVKNHVHNLLEKLHVKRRAQAARV